MFDPLVQLSAGMVPNTGDGMPAIQLSFHQVFDRAHSLLASRPRAAHAADALAASRLLAREGVDAERLGRDVRAMDLRPGPGGGGPDGGGGGPSYANNGGLLLGGGGPRRGR